MATANELSGTFHPEHYIEGARCEPDRGITVRQWYAGMAMQAAIVNPRDYDEVKDPASCAAFAFKQADAMIAESEKQ